MCDIWKTKGFSALELADYQTIFRASPKSVVWLSVTGGEPFLRKDLEQIVRLAQDCFPKLKLISLTTNGISYSIASRLSKLLRASRRTRYHVNLSVDGLGDGHDSLRGVAGNFVRIQKLTKRFQRIKRLFPSKFSYSFETTLVSQNVHALDDIRTYAISQKASHFMTVGRASRFYKNEISRSALFLEKQAVTERVSHLRSSISLWGPLSQWVERAYYAGILCFFGQRKHPVECVASQGSAVVMSDGRVQPCIHWDPGLGNVLGANNLGEILENEKNLAVRNKVREQECPGCWTPCEAFPSLLTAPWKLIALAQERTQKISNNLVEQRALAE